MDTIGQAFISYQLKNYGYRLTILRKAAKHHRNSGKLYGSIKGAYEVITSMSPQGWLELSQSIPRGGDRRSMYRHLVTKQIRVPVVFHEKIEAIAHWIDENPDRLDELMAIITTSQGDD